MSYVHAGGERPLEMKTVGQIFENAVERWPEKYFLISEAESRRMTYGDVSIEVNKFASGLISCGFKPNDRIAIWSPNSSKWFIAMLAAAKLGIITVGINPANTFNELEFCLAKSEAKGLILPTSVKNQNNERGLLQMLPELNTCRPGELASDKLKNLKSVIFTDKATTLSGAFTFENVANMTENCNNLSTHGCPESTYSILFTSGTTGLPKAAAQSHYSYVNNSRDLGYRCELDSAHHAICLQIPFFHAFGMLVSLAAIQHGSTIVIPSFTYNIDSSWKAIVDEKCSVLTGTPTMYVDLLKKKQETGMDVFSKIAITGGATCSPFLFQQIKKHLKTDYLKSVYGMTEILSGFVSVPNEDECQAMETVGKLFDHVEAKVVDKNGNTVPMGTPGELLIRGYANMTEYWGDRAKTSEILDKKGWLRTGDQFILNGDGYGQIHGRFKDIIIRGGENIIPREIEDFINTHPDVVETQVFGVKDDRMGEEICASIRVRQGSVFDYGKMKAFCKGAIAHYKIPKYFKVVDEFPKTSSGKIQKYKLKEMVESGTL